jgi:hypothetical protein
MRFLPEGRAHSTGIPHIHQFHYIRPYITVVPVPVPSHICNKFESGRVASQSVTRHLIEVTFLLQSAPGTADGAPEVGRTHENYRRNISDLTKCRADADKRPTKNVAKEALLDFFTQLIVRLSQPAIKP